MGPHWKNENGPWWWASAKHALCARRPPLFSRQFDSSFPAAGDSGGWPEFSFSFTTASPPPLPHLPVFSSLVVSAGGGWKGLASCRRRWRSRSRPTNLPGLLRRSALAPGSFRRSAWRISCATAAWRLSLATMSTSSPGRMEVSVLLLLGSCGVPWIFDSLVVAFWWGFRW